MNDVKQKLDKIIQQEDWKVDEVIEQDYSLSPVVDCIIYYITGFYNFYLGPP